MKVVYTIFFYLFSLLSAQAYDFDAKVISKLGLKTITIYTVNKEEPTCDFAEAPEGCMGITSINATKVPCRIVISDADSVLYDSGIYKKSESGATIKINGNTSAFYSVGENRPFKIKLQKKADLLFRNDEKYTDKDWRLITDAITLNTIIGLKLSELLQMSWTPHYTPCNLFINDDYRGCYLLIESVERNADCRINVNKKTGYIIERDPYWWAENQYFETDYFASSKGYRWTWKYPDEEDITDDQTSYIQQYINQTEQSIYNGNYQKYIDVESFAKWVLAQDILGTRDSGGSNLYITKYDSTNNSLLEIPCLWDFDSNFQIKLGFFSKIHDNAYDFYYHHLFNSSNKAFIRAYKTLWNRIYPTLLTDMIEFIKNYIQSNEGKALDLSRKYHFKRWDYGVETVKIVDDGKKAIEWFNSHINLLNNSINALDDINSAIHQIPTNTNADNEVYSLTGIRNNVNHKKIYIKNGKKYIAK